MYRGSWAGGGRRGVREVREGDWVGIVLCVLLERGGSGDGLIREVIWLRLYGWLWTRFTVVSCTEM